MEHRATDAVGGSYLTLWLFVSSPENRALELNGARSNPRVGVELVRLGALRDELLRRALVNPREPRPTPAKVSPVLETVTLVLELAGEPMRVREIHAAAEQLAGESLRWSSVKGTLAAYAGGSNPRFERVRRGYYRIRGHVMRHDLNR